MFSPDTTKTDMKKLWFADYMTTFVAEEGGHFLGTYIIKPNQIGLGNHIANCSYMVSPEAQGKGIGKKLFEHSIQFAQESDYMGIQFNIVVSTNMGAVELWKKYGFEITGTTSNGFRHLKLGFVDYPQQGEQLIGQNQNQQKAYKKKQIVSILGLSQL